MSLTQAGSDCLAAGPERIGVKDHDQFTGFRAWRLAGKDAIQLPDDDPAVPVAALRAGGGDRDCACGSWSRRCATSFWVSSGP